MAMTSKKTRTRTLTFLVCLVFNMFASGQDKTLIQGEGSADDAVRPVGEVSMVIGRAYLLSDVVGEERLNRGDFLREGDRIRTESSGHVHVTFRDDAVLSVRPNSELHIVSYRFDAEDPENSQVKFSLLQGTARTVSGKAATAARERFRLNTPIAAIGVRGTDFVVSATEDSLMALVNEGAIVVAPFSTQCVAQGIGPCNLNSVELDSESMQVIEFDSSMNIPQLVPVLTGGRDAQQITELFNGVAARDRSFEEDYQADLEISPQSEDEANASAKEVVTESVTSLDLGAKAADQAPYETGFTPIDQAIPSELRDRQLVWGRFARGKGNLERLTLPLSEASEGRQVTVGGNFEYFLFRPEADEAQVDGGLGQIGFSLTSAQAYFKAEESITPVAVSGGDLRINFNTNAFRTSLDLYHMQLGEANFSASGRLYPGGYFHSRDGESRMVGAVSLDGTESGYFFDFYNWDGLLQGITLWDAN